MVEDTQKRYADDITLQELVRLRVENERLREALHTIAATKNVDPSADAKTMWVGCTQIARSALQQKETE